MNCTRCGRSLKRPVWYQGKAYGSTCIKKVAKQGGAQQMTLDKKMKLDQNGTRYILKQCQQKIANGQSLSLAMQYWLCAELRVHLGEPEVDEPAKVVNIFDYQGKRK